MDEWVDVKHKLPFTPKNLEESKALGMDWYSSDPVLCVVESPFRPKPVIAVLQFDGYAKRWGDIDRDEYRGTAKVTHWQPLPDLPNKSK